MNSINFTEDTKVYYLVEKMKNINELRILLENFREKDYLHRIVMKTGKYEDLNKYIVEYLNLYPDVINNKDEEGRTALMLASENSYELSTDKTVKILIEHGADLNIVDNKNRTALFYAILAINQLSPTSTERTIELLIKNGSKINLDEDKVYNNEDLENLKLSEYIDDCDFSPILNIVKILSENNFKNLYDRSEETGYNIIMLVIIEFKNNNKFKLVKKLLKLNCNIEEQNNNGETALLYTINDNSFSFDEDILKIVKLFVEQGANIEHSDKINFNSITSTLFNGRNDIIEILLPSRKIFIDKIKKNKRRIISNNCYYRGTKILKIIPYDFKLDYYYSKDFRGVLWHM